MLCSGQSTPADALLFLRGNYDEFPLKKFQKISTQLLIMEIDFCPVDQMAWVRTDNQHRAIAEEIILKELIYI